MKKCIVPQPPVARQYRIQAKSSEFVFCPANAIEHEFYLRNQNIIPELVSSDGIVHRCTFVGTWNNAGGIYEDEFENICQSRYGMPFVSIRSMWIGRIGRIDDYWHLIKLEKIWTQKRQWEGLKMVTPWEFKRRCYWCVPTERAIFLSMVRSGRR